MTLPDIATFIHIEKTGGTTLLEAIRRSTAFRHCDLIPIAKTAQYAEERDISRALLAYPKLRSLAGHSIRPYLDFGVHRPRLKYYTLLRPGVKRYISDFNHDRFKRGYTGSLKDWLTFEDRWNFQTCAIAGEPNLEKAKQILVDSFAVVGLLENYDEFVDDVATLLTPLKLDRKITVMNKAGTQLGRIDSKNSVKVLRPEDEFDDSVMKMVAEKNELDQKLYEFVKSEIVPRQQAAAIEQSAKTSLPSPKMQKFIRRLGGAWRNAVYKPTVGRMPMQPHRLPRNEMNSEEWVRHIAKMNATNDETSEKV